MAHFAELVDNVVIQVIVIDNAVCETEQDGILYLHNLFNDNNRKWLQTSYNGKIRKNFAGIGYIYNEQLDAFISPKPYNSWILDEKTCKWNPPIEKPKGNYYWSESEQNWKPYDFTNNT